jgi:hypothetical protein
MVDPEDVEKIVIDAARLMRRGEIIVFGSAELAFWVKAAPSSRDVAPASWRTRAKTLRLEDFPLRTTSSWPGWRGWK